MNYEEKRKKSEAEFYALHKEVLTSVRALTKDMREKLEELEPLFKKYRKLNTHYLEYDSIRVRGNLLSAIETIEFASMAGEEPIRTPKEQEAYEDFIYKSLGEGYVYD